MEDFNPPPSLTRISFPGDNTTTHDGSSEGSLHVLTGEVVEAQKYQANELASKEDLLKKLQVELQSITYQQEVVQNDVKSVRRQIYLLQDDVCRKQKLCAQLQDDIMKQLEQKRRVQMKCCEVKWSRSQENDIYTKYREKIRCYRDNIQSFYEENETQKKTKELRREITEQQMKIFKLSKEDAIAADESVTLEQELTKLSEKKDTLTEEIVELEEQITKARENVLMMKKETDALHKRNTSQLTRLKQQVAATDEKIKKVSIENRSLQEKIEVIKGKVTM